MSTEVKSELSREMSLFHITMMGVGMMIGAGVFVSTGIGIGVAGPGGILLAFALNGLLAFLSVMTYAELGSALPNAGAGYSYVQESSGGMLGFFTGWISWFGHSVAGSLYAITFAKYTLHFLSGFEAFQWLNLNLPLYERIVAVALALVFIYINYRGASETGRAGAAIAIGQTIVLAAIGIGGVIVFLRNPGKAANFTPFLSAGWGKVLVIMGFSLIGFEGYEVISNTAEEVIDAKKNVPKGIFYAVIIVITTYLLVAFAAIVGGGSLGGSVVEWFRAQGATGFAEAIGRLFPLGGLLVVLAAIFASTSALNATIYSSTRVSFALGRDGHLPAFFAHISKKTRIPDIALLFSGAITIIIAAGFPIEVVTAGASIFFIFLFNVVTLSGMKIRIERGHELNYGYLMPFFPFVPIVSILGRTIIGVFLFDMGFMAYIVAGSWLLLGLFYYYSHPKREKTERKSELALNKETGEEPEGEHILVSVATAENAPTLMKYAGILAGDGSTGIVLFSVIRVPYQTPIDVAERFTGEARELIERTAESAPKPLALRCFVRYAHNTAQGIIHAVRARNAGLLILGWRGYTSRKNYRMGSTLDPVIEKAACDLVVIKVGEGDPEKRIEKILCPTKGRGPHGKLAWDLVKRIAAEHNAEVTIMHVTGTDRKGTIPEKLKDSAAAVYEGTKYRMKIMRSSDPVGLIIDESKAHDLVVIGASASSLFQRILFGSVPRRIAESCSCTVMMVRKNTGIRFWFKRWFL
jgi:amino acid transporter